jgi:hypothetical protein
MGCATFCHNGSQLELHDRLGHAKLAMELDTRWGGIIERRDESTIHKIFGS